MTPAVARSLGVALVVLLVTPVGAAAAPSTASSTAPPTAPPGADADRRLAPGVDAASASVPVSASASASGSPASATGPTLSQRITFARDPDPGRVTATVAYDVPRSVTELTVRLPALATESAALADRSGFRRLNATTFEWTGESAPSVTLHLTVGNATYGVGDRGVEGDGWAFAIEPATGVSWRYYGTKPVYREELAVDGSGYTRDHLAYMGPYDDTTADVGDERATFVVSTVTGRSTGSLSNLTSFLTVANDHFDFGVRRAELTVFVLPIDETGVNHLEGATVGTSMWVTTRSLALDSQGNAFAHEYVHTRLGVVGEGSATWLTEATATYYGHAFSLNYGVGTFDDFHRAMTAERFAPDGNGVVLTETATWEGTLANYQKGAHVLAALDAEIRTRTDGRHTLPDVYDESRSFSSYAAFRAAVVEVADDPSLGSWLDRYATTTALPPVPDDPSLYVYGKPLDPDGDGLSSQRELDLGTNPFAADTDGDGIADGADEQPLTARTETATKTEPESETATRESETAPSRTTQAAVETETTTTSDGFGVLVAGAAALTLAAVALARRT